MAERLSTAVEDPVITNTFVWTSLLTSKQKLGKKNTYVQLIAKIPFVYNTVLDYAV